MLEFTIPGAMPKSKSSQGIELLKWKKHFGVELKISLLDGHPYA